MDVIKKMCGHPGCTKRPSYGMPGEKSEFCYQRAGQDMVSSWKPPSSKKSGSRESGWHGREHEGKEVDVDVPRSRPAVTKKRVRQAGAVPSVSIAVKAEEKRDEVMRCSSSTTIGSCKRARPISFTPSVPTAVKVEGTGRRADTLAQSSSLDSGPETVAIVEIGVAVVA